MDKIFKYSEYNGEIIITGLKESVSDTSIVIPETINGMPVTAIGAKAFESTSITGIKIGENIKVLGKQAFSECKNLKSAIWNCKCNAIPDYCFYRCTKLKHFDFSGIEKIGIYAFGKSGLQEVFLPENIKNIEGGTFKECSGLRFVAWNCACDVIPSYCFYMCPNLTNFDFAGIKKIEQDAFGKSGLISVTLNKETAVVQSCFAFCESLAKVEWLSARSIKGDIFKGCKNIKEIFISDKVKNIEASAFVSSPNAEITFV